MRMKFFFIILVGVFSLSAHAYIGPGMGAGVIASVLGILFSLVLAIAGLIYYPIKRFLKKRKAINRSDDQS